MKRCTFACYAVALLCSTCLTAGPINVPGIIPNYLANGADLAGLLVTVTWDFGPLTSEPGIHSFIYTWGATGADSGGIQAWFTTIPILGLSGNSATVAWIFNGLYADPVLSIMLDGTAAGIMFDRSLPSPGTPGTGAGNDAIATGIPATFMGIPATYSNPVGVAGAPPVGDLYSQLRFDLQGPAQYSRLSFTQATVLATPEPAAFVVTLLGLALVVSGLSAERRRRHHRGAAQCIRQERTR